MNSSRSLSPQEASEEGRVIQQEVDRKEVEKPSSSPKHTAMQAGIRDYPTEFAAQQSP